MIMCGVWREGNQVEANRKLAHVGMTRACERLAVIVSGDHPLIADLESANKLQG